MLNKKILLVIMLAGALLTACSKNGTMQTVNQTPAAPQTKITDSAAKTGNTDSAVAKQVVDNNKEEVYKNDKLGFSFVMPESWKGKYSIEESKDGISVYFKPSEPAENPGLFFEILKRSTVKSEDYFDTVGEPRTFSAKGIEYIVGGPTGVTFQEGHKEFSMFLKMSREVPQVVKTIKTSN